MSTTTTASPATRHRRPPNRRVDTTVLARHLDSIRTRILRAVIDDGASVEIEDVTLSDGVDPCGWQILVTVVRDDG